MVAVVLMAQLEVVVVVRKVGVAQVGVVDADLAAVVVVRKNYPSIYLVLLFNSFLMRKFVYFVLFLLVTTLILPACRTKGPEEKKQTYDGIELTYYKVFDDSEVLEPIIAEYEAAHPGLKINYRQFVDFEEYERLILNELAEGEGPDIFSMQNTWFASNYKKLSPLPENFGTVDDFNSTFADVAAKDLVRTDQAGVERVYGVPMTVDTLALYYNKAHFEDRIPSRGKPSDTWEGIKEDVVFLNKEDNSLGRFEVAGIAMGRGDNISRGVDILYLLFLQYGVNFYNENISEATFASQTGGAGQYPAATALDFFASFADENQKNYSWNKFIADPDSAEKELDAFVEGKVSMIVGFSYTYDEILQRINALKTDGVSTIDPADVRIAPIPQIVDPDVSTQKRVTYANYFAETVARTSEHPDIAWDFLLELTKKKNLQHYFDKTHKPTSRRDMIDEQKKDPIYGVFAGQVGFAESFPIIDYYDYKNIFTDIIEAVVEDGGQARGLLTKAQETINAMLPIEGILVPKAAVPTGDEADAPAKTE